MSSMRSGSSPPVTLASDDHAAKRSSKNAGFVAQIHLMALAVTPSPKSDGDCQVYWRPAPILITVLQVCIQ